MPPKKNKKDEDKKEKKEELAETESVTEEQVVSTKKVVYVEIDDEVTAVYDKIKPVRAKHVYIVVPKRAILFQSVVNLKILKRKSEEAGKTIYFVTNDGNGIYLAQQLGIEVYNQANSEGKPALFSTEVQDEQLRITPLRATVNSIEDEPPPRLKERKLSISEILNKRKSNKNIDVSKLDAQKKKSKSARPKLVVMGPNRHLLFSLVAVSLVILLVIVYIALPGATIHLTPSASVLEKSVNITLADYNSNKAELETRPPHMIASYPVSTTVTTTITHYSTGKKFSEKGSNAGGKITIFNTTKNDWPLIPQTRFQTDEGIVFRLQNAVTVPAATANGPGTLEVPVVADPVDAFGTIVGERGNIAPSSFFLPGLNESSRSELYAESSDPMTGGVTDFVAYISQEDLDAASSRLEDELMKNAIAELEKAVAEKSELVGDGTIYTLLDGEGAVKIGEVSVDVPSGLLNQEQAEFTVSGEVFVSGVYYDHDEMLEILKNELTLKKSPQKELLRINEESTSYRIFEWNNTNGKIKLTANIKGIEQFSIDPSKESGERLLNKIKDHILGKEIDEAKNYIQNLPEINKVEIESWPAWSPTIPKFPDNIEFEIREAVTIE